MLAVQQLVKEISAVECPIAKRQKLDDLYCSEPMRSLHKAVAMVHLETKKEGQVQALLDITLGQINKPVSY